MGVQPTKYEDIQVEKTTHVTQEVSKLTRKQFASKISEYVHLLGANLDLSKLSAGRVLTEADVKAKKILREDFEKQFHELRALIDDLTIKKPPGAASPDKAPAEGGLRPRHPRGGKTNGGYATLGDALKDAGIDAGRPQPDTEPEKETAVADSNGPEEGKPEEELDVGPDTDDPNELKKLIKFDRIRIRDLLRGSVTAEATRRSMDARIGKLVGDLERYQRLGLLLEPENPSASSRELEEAFCGLKGLVKTLGDERDAMTGAMETAQAATKTAPEAQPAAGSYPLLTSLCRRLNISPEVLAQRIEELLTTAGSLQELQGKLARHGQLQGEVVELQKRAVPDWMITSLGLEIASITQEQLDQRLERLATLFKKRSEEVERLTAQLQQQEGEGMSRFSEEQSSQDPASTEPDNPNWAYRSGLWLKEKRQYFMVGLGCIAIAGIALALFLLVDLDRSMKQAAQVSHKEPAAPTPPIQGASEPEASPVKNDIPAESETARETADVSNSAEKPPLSDYELWRQSYREQRQALKEKLTSTPTP